MKPIEPAVITVGSIHGGSKHNIIGEECHLQLTVRSYSPEVREQLKTAIVRKANAMLDAGDVMSTMLGQGLEAWLAEHDPSPAG